MGIFLFLFFCQEKYHLPGFELTSQRVRRFRCYQLSYRGVQFNKYTHAFGNLEGAVRRGRGGKEKEWTDCVQSDIRTFGIAGDWKAMALNAEVWVETFTEGGRRFMAAWRKEEVDAARHRQEKREATRLGTLLSQTGV